MTLPEDLKLAEQYQPVDPTAPNTNGPRYIISKWEHGLKKNSTLYLVPIGKKQAYDYR